MSTLQNPKAYWKAAHNKPHYVKFNADFEYFLANPYSTEDRIYDVIKNIDFGVTDYGLEVIGASEVALSNLKLHVFGDARVGRARLSVTKAVVPDTMTTAGLGGGINYPLTEAIILSPNLQYTHYFKLTSPKQNSFDTMDVLATVKFLF